MVVHIQHLQCLSKDDKDHEDNPTGWWWMFWFPSEKKTNRQGTALTDNHCMHWEHPRKEQRAERRAPIGRVRQKKMAAGSERSRKNDRSLCGRQFSNVQSFECCKSQTRSKRRSRTRVGMGWGNHINSTESAPEGSMACNIRSSSNGWPPKFLWMAKHKILSAATAKTISLEAHKEIKRGISFRNWTHLNTIAKTQQ